MTNTCADSRTDVTTEALASLITWYETLSPASLPRIGDFYTADAHFVDPFNDVRGLASIERVFRHMFATLESPRFEVFAVTTGQVRNETVKALPKMDSPDLAMLCWRFHFRLRNRDWSIEGSSALQFDASGRVLSHRDYWDPAKEVYGSLPLIGPLLRWLARRLSAR